MPRVTLNDIAKSVGCSKAAVSYALQNHPSISQATRDRIQKVAQTLGWTPNAELRQQMALVRSSASGRDLPNLAIIINRSQDQLEAITTIRLHLAGATERARELGYGVDVFNLHDTPLTPKRLITMLKTRGIRGVLVIDFEPTTPREYWRIAHDFATVSVGIDPVHTPVTISLIDYLSVGRRTIKELKSLGYEYPGPVLPSGTDRLVNGGFTGGLSAGLACNPTVKQLPIYYAGNKRDIFIQKKESPALQRWIQENQPDVLVSPDASGLVRTLESTPYASLPVFSLDWDADQKVAGGIDQRSYTVGVAGADALIAQLDRGEFGLPKTQKTVLVHEAWIAPSARA